MSARVFSAHRRSILAWTLAPLLLAVIHGLVFRFVVDDAFISLRYAANLVAGHGLVFNPGEPVEGYSNLLWVLLLAGGLELEIEPLLWARLLGVLFTGAMLVLLPGCVRMLSPDHTNRTPWSGRVAQLLTAATGAVCCWMLAGLETSLFTFLAVLAWRSALKRRPLPAGLVGLLMVLTRPEGPALAGIFLAWSLLPGPGLRPAVSPLRRPVTWVGPAILVLGTAAFFLWRHATYGWWLPNTYYAKTGDLAGQLRTGLPYTLSFLRVYGPALIVLVVAGIVRGEVPSRGRRDFLFSAATVMAWCSYVTVIGGDMLGMFRFFVPILPILTALSVAVATSTGWFCGPRGSLTVAVIFGLALLPGSIWGKERRLVAAHMSEANLGGWILAGDALAGLLPDGATIALGPAGYIPWKTGAVCYDFYGLVDPEIAHMDVVFTHGYAGHEKTDGALVLLRRPDYVLIGNVDITGAPRTGLIPPLDREIDIVRHEAFQRNYEQVWIPVAGGKVLNLFQRKGLALPLVR